MALPGTVITTPATPTFPITYYCDPGDVQRRLSIEGVSLKTEDYGNGSIGGEAGVIEEAIFDATETINFYCYSHYDPGSMANSYWINRRATDIAVYLLSLRRGNIPSASIEARYNQAIQWLQLVHDDVYEIPGVPVRITRAPSWSNVHIDQRFPTFRVRVETEISDRTAARYPQSVDWSSYYAYDI